jgi:hypothetical protein
LEIYMARPRGSKNKSPRELRAESNRLKQIAKLREQIARLKKRAAR